MTSNTFHLLPSLQVVNIKTKLERYYSQGYNSYGHGYDIPKFTGKAAELANQVFSEIMAGPKDGDYVCFILRHDQVTEFEKNKASAKDIKFELVHKSPDFTNLNYCCSNGNYLNFYIYKVQYV